VSVSLESGFCLAALEWALQQGRPEIFNTDQGAQFTSELFTGRLEASGIVISMDGRGRAMDNIFVERLWRMVKYEAVYLNNYEQGGRRCGIWEAIFSFTIRSVRTRRWATRRRRRCTSENGEKLDETQKGGCCRSSDVVERGRGREISL
jgi:transposase InsO family protein